MTASQAWKFVTLADVGTVITGNTPPTKELHYYGSDIPFVKPTELVDKPIHAAPQMLSYAGAEVARKVPAGAVLVSCIGNLGKTGIARVPVSLNQQINAIVFRNEVLPEFGFYYAQTLKRWLHGQSSATTIPIVNKGKFQQAPFPLAPLEVQHRIVAEIEKQFSRLDEAIAGLKRVKANLNRYRASVLDVFFVDEPNVCLGDVIESGPQNGLYLPKNAYGSGTPMLRINDYQTDWMRPVAELRRVNATEAQVKTWALREGDIVVNRVNSMSHLGKCASMPASLAGTLFESNMMRMGLKGLALPRYVELYLGGSRGRGRLTQRAKWAVNQASINQQDLMATPLPLPPLAEQHRVVAEVDRLLSIAREAEAEVETSLKRGASLRAAILTKSFGWSSDGLD